MLRMTTPNCIAPSSEEIESSAHCCVESLIYDQMTQSWQIGKKPRYFLLAALLVGGDVFLVLQRQANFIESLEQAVFAKWINVKMEGGSRRSRHRLCRK